MSNHALRKEDGWPVLKCYYGEEHDVNLEADLANHLVYACSRCGIKMPFYKHITPEQIISQEP